MALLKSLDPLPFAPQQRARTAADLHGTAWIEASEPLLMQVRAE